MDKERQVVNKSVNNRHPGALQDWICPKLFFSFFFSEYSGNTLLFHTEHP
jgi:hypothetical protein